MLKHVKRTMIFAALCAASYTTQASLVTHNGYTLDTATNIVSNGAVEWLQWDETAGQSIPQALATYASAGWVLASNDTMADLFSDFFADITWSSDENVGTFFNSAGSPASWFANVANFSDLFGTTFAGGTIVVSSAVYGSDDDGDGNYNIANVQNTGVVLGTSLSVDTAFIGNFVNSSVGIALIRAAAPITQTTPVSEPSALALLLAGSCGLFLRRRKS